MSARDPLPNGALPKSLVDLRVVVVGMGKSGVAAARLAHRRGAAVTANDAAPLEVWSEDARALLGLGIAVVAGGHEAARLHASDLVVVSPGVANFPELEAAERAGVPVIGEVELSVRELLRDGRHVPVVAVGGTNGKSTTTALVHELLTARGLRTFIGGNFGEPLALHVDEPWDAVVLEVSSFQLERAPTFRPDVSILLNVTPDHLDRYASEAAYARAKGNAFQNQRPGDLAIVPHGDAVCLGEAGRGRAKIVTFGPDEAADARVTPEAVVDARTGERFARRDLALTGGHNALNVAAALLAVTPFDVGPAVARDVLARFRGLAHRTARVAEIDGVVYYDDSKGTNVGATVTALRGLTEARAVLIAGGRDKGGSYGPLADALRDKGRAVVVLGEASELIARATEGACDVVRATSMTDAVDKARALAEPGDAVLLSPACSSFDMFRDYKHRGDAFVHAVEALARASAGGPETFPETTS